MAHEPKALKLTFRQQLRSSLSRGEWHTCRLRPRECEKNSIHESSLKLFNACPKLEQIIPLNTCLPVCRLPAGRAYQDGEGCAVRITMVMDGLAGLSEFQCVRFEVGFAGSGGRLLMDCALEHVQVFP